MQQDDQESASSFRSFDSSSGEDIHIAHRVIAGPRCPDSQSTQVFCAARRSTVVHELRRRTTRRLARRLALARARMSTQQPDEETALEVRAPQIRSLAWLRPTGQFYSNPAHIHRARKRRHARVPPDTFKRTSYTSRGGVGSPRASELRSPPRQHAKSKHSRGSPKAARRPVTTDRRQRAAAWASSTTSRRCLPRRSRLLSRS